MNSNENNKPAVFVTRRLPEEIWQRLNQHVDAQIWDLETPPPYDTLLQKVQNKEGLLCLLTDRIDENLIKSGSDLKVISQIAVGYDNIDVEAATEQGIRVGNTPGVLTDATADFTFTLLMTAARRVGEAIDYVRENRWKTWGLTLLLGHDVQGCTLGIIGFGRIGQAVAKRARGFDMKVLYYDHNQHPQIEEQLGAERRKLDDLLQESDYVSVHVSLNEESEGMIGRRELHLMKPSAVLINTARGPIIQADALYEALKEKEIAYAAVDVTDPEPLPADSKLLSLDNIIITPHIASATISSRMKMCHMAVDNLLAGIRGDDLPFPVN